MNKFMETYLKFLEQRTLYVFENDNRSSKLFREFFWDKEEMNNLGWLSILNNNNNNYEIKTVTEKEKIINIIEILLHQNCDYFERYILEFTKELISCCLEYDNIQYICEGFFCELNSICRSYFFVMQMSFVKNIDEVHIIHNFIKHLYYFDCKQHT